MSLFAISDLHLSLGTNKSMTVFRGWEDYVSRIEKNWRRIVTATDTVVIPGDFSWGLKIEDTLEDFKLLESLPGKKILLKGNHDLWWCTVKKVKEFFAKNNINSVELVFNTAIKVEDFVVCGTRGWFYDESSDSKIRRREAERLRRSLIMADELGGEKKVFLHYPPVYGEYVCEDILEVLREYNVKKVYHGHIHGSGLNNSVTSYGGIDFKLISADCIDFAPILLL